KTQLALEYAYRSRSDYQYVLWVNAATPQTLIEGFLSIAKPLDLPAKDEPDQNMVLAAVQHWLTTHSRWLLILDNADDLTLVSEFVPAADTGHTLLTTREHAWGSIARSF